MKVIPDGLSQDDAKENISSIELKVKDENGLSDSIDNMKKMESTVKSKVENTDSSSDEEESNTTVEEEKKVSNCDKDEEQKETNEDHVDELTTQVMKMKVKDEKKDKSSQNICEKFSNLSVKEEAKNSALKPRGPDGGKPTSFNQMMYGQQDWSVLQADVRMKAMSGKRGFDEEYNPYKYTKNSETTYNGDYSDMAYMEPVNQTYQHQQIPSMSQASTNLVYTTQQQAMQTPRAQAYRRNQNLGDLPQHSVNYPDYSMRNTTRTVLSGGSVSVTPSDQIVPNSMGFNQDVWDPDDILEMLDGPQEQALLQNDGYPQKNSTPFYQQNQTAFQSNDTLVNNQTNINALQKTKRNHSGDESEYDSEASRMSVTSPYSPDSGISLDSSPQSVTQSSPYMSQLPFSPASNIGSPHSVDSGMMSAGSPASYGDMSSPGNHFSVMSPGNADSPNIPLLVDQQAPADSIMSELNKPIPKSPINSSMPPEQYIDSHLSDLRDLYEVLANDLSEGQQKWKKNLKAESEIKPTNISVETPTPKVANNHQVPVRKANLTKTPKVKVTGTPVTTSMSPVFLQSVPSTGNPVITTCSNSNPPQLVQVQGGAGKLPIVGQPIVPVTGAQNIVFVPLSSNPGMFNAAASSPIIVVRQGPSTNQKKGGPTKPRPILPKMPNIMPGNSTASSTTTSPSRKKGGTVTSPSSKTHTTNSPMCNLQQAPVYSQNISKLPGAMITSSQVSSGMVQQAALKQNSLHLQGSVLSHAPNGPQHGVQRNEAGGTTTLNLARRYVAEMKTEDLHYQDRDGDTYLHVAICRTDPYLVQAILERLSRQNLLKEMIDKENKKRQTPLYVAVADNQPLMVQELVKCGADPNCLAECLWENGMKEVKAAIHCAAQGGHLFSRTLQELLKAKDIALNLSNSEGLTALHCSIKEHGKMRGGQVIDSIPSVEMLIRAGADPNLQDKKSGKTPLMYAIETKDFNLVSCMVSLIDKGKLRNMLKTQTFDGSNCSKICSGLRMESDLCGWRKINSLINGTDPRMFDTSPIMSM